MLQYPKQDSPDTEVVRAWLQEAFERGAPSGQTATGLAQHVGVTAQAVSGWRRTGRITKGNLVAAQAYFGHGPQFPDGAIHSVREPLDHQLGYAPGSRGLVPLISWAKAGGWSEADDSLHPGDAERWLSCPVVHSSRSFALRVRGDSMTAPLGNTRSYPAGCIIFVDPDRLAPVNGERILARRVASSEVTFKCFKHEDGRLWLQPLNPMHQPIHDEFLVLGTIIGKWEDE